MASSVFRHAFGMVGWFAMATAFLALTGWAVVEYYLSLRSGLELLGFEQQPLWRDGLIGRLLNAFIPEATLTQAFALTIAVTKTLVLLVVCDVITRIGRLMQHRRNMLRLGNQAEAREAATRAAELVAVLLLIVAWLVVALRFDFELYRLRSIAGSLGMELPEEVVELPTWTSLADQPDLLPYSVTLATVGAWGYLAFTVLGGFGTHYSFGKVGDNFTYVMAPVDAWFGGDALVAGDEVDDEQDQALAALDDPDPPSEADLDPDIDGGHGTFESTHDPELRDAPVTPPAAGEAKSDEALFPPPRKPGTTAAQSPTNSDVTAGEAPTALADRSDDAATATRSSTRQRSAPTADPAGRLPIIGSAHGERTTMTEARRDPARLYIDPETGRIWDRAYWDLLHGADHATNRGEAGTSGQEELP